jgi:hypothetical protein
MTHGTWQDDTTHEDDSAAVQVEARPVGVGSVGPDFALESSDGPWVRLSDFRGVSKVVLYFMREFT